MATITITGGSVCPGGNHRTVTTDQGTVTFLDSEIQAASADTLAELKRDFIIILKHQYFARKAAGRTHAQALSDLVGFVVRL